MIWLPTLKLYPFEDQSLCLLFSLMYLRVLEHFLEYIHAKYILNKRLIVPFNVQGKVSDLVYRDK